MAMNPDMMSKDDMGATTDASATTDDSAPTGGYCIEIKVTADGKMSVGVEPQADDAAEEGGENGDEGEYQSVSGMSDLMRLIKDIVSNAGQIEDISGGQDEMSAGYGKPDPMA